MTTTTQNRPLNVKQGPLGHEAKNMAKKAILAAFDLRLARLKKVRESLDRLDNELDIVKNIVEKKTNTITMIDPTTLLKVLKG